MAKHRVYERHIELLKRHLATLESGEPVNGNGDVNGNGNTGNATSTDTSTDTSTGTATETNTGEVARLQGELAELRDRIKYMEAQGGAVDPSTRVGMAVVRGALPELSAVDSAL